MFLAWREMLFARTRFLLMGLVLALMSILIVIISGLTAGLVNDGVSGLKAMDADAIAFEEGTKTDSAFTRSIVDLGKVDEVATNDQSSFLPSSAEATRVQERLAAFTGAETIPAVVVVSGQGPLTTAELADIDDDFAGFETLEAWDDYDRFNDEIDDALLPSPTPIDPELEEILTRLEAEWRSKM